MTTYEVRIGEKILKIEADGVAWGGNGLRFEIKGIPCAVFQVWDYWREMKESEAGLVHQSDPPIPR